MSQSIIEVQNISKSYMVKSQQIAVLNNVTFEVRQGDFLVILGPSGCGKSTILHTLIGLEPPTTGSVKVLGENLYADTTEDERSRFRKYHLGMIYQQPNWIKSYTVMENLTFPLLLIGENKDVLVQKASVALDQVGMLPWSFYIPTELSSGQQQKIALARALITNPEIIIADEPTGNLDFHSGEELMQILQMLNKQGKTIVMVTHDLEYIKYANRALTIRDGKILKEYNENETKELSHKITSKRGVPDLILG